MLLFLYPDILCPVTMLRIVQISRGECRTAELPSLLPHPPWRILLPRELSTQVLKSGIVNNIWLTTLTPSCTLTSVI